MNFIRLTGMLINPSTIRTIAISDTRYTIHFTSERFQGHMLLGSGVVASYSAEIVVDKEKNSTDYRMLQCWLSKNT
jgi:hypothetical protein